jgi:vitamin B12/bleomycin/antimicrobial peptide transport system ATP-binding/permease protein
MLDKVGCVSPSEGLAGMAQDHKVGGRTLFLRFWACASGFWKGKSARVSWALTAGLLTLALTQLAVRHPHYWNRDFFNALERRDGARLWGHLDFRAIGMPEYFAVGRFRVGPHDHPAQMARVAHETSIGVMAQDDRYRRLKFVTGEYQNAEYRICLDARSATDAPVDMALGLFAAVATAVVFIEVLWAVGGSLRSRLADMR